jgi:general secretion pathway protein I
MKNNSKKMLSVFVTKSDAKEQSYAFDFICVHLRLCVAKTSFQHAKKNKGFTLIEVLIALAILAIALAATMRVIGMATSSAEEVKIKTYATWVSQNRLAELTARRVFPAAGSENGQVNMAGIDFVWQQTTSETPNKEFRKVEVSVSLPNQERKRANLSAYLSRGGT